MKYMIHHNRNEKETQRHDRDRVIKNQFSSYYNQQQTQIQHPKLNIQKLKNVDSKSENREQKINNM